ncbi:MAG: hypothetical protein JJU34_00705 [Lunatimonas sp.]|uniref:hypothetical protein n=1 Tax=Lunatimonas sp. TaxID=2060141 RepID=UPI00263BA870|nr:hypothetical protein [Lunatimonas sp.]MCC5935774.1 hypothetical protein [Lunatimonas sp.]
METIYYLVRVLAFAAFLALVSGMIRPVTVLWFCAVANRLGVIKYFGTAFIVLVAIEALLKGYFLAV